MTIIGIAGCSALLVAGFGINDSISDVVINNIMLFIIMMQQFLLKQVEVTSQIKSLRR